MCLFQNKQIVSSFSLEKAFYDDMQLYKQNVIKFQGWTGTISQLRISDEITQDIFEFPDILDGNDNEDYD